MIFRAGQEIQMREVRQSVQAQTQPLPAFQVRVRRSAPIRVRILREGLHPESYPETAQGFLTFHRRLQVQ